MDCLWLKRPSVKGIKLVCWTVPFLYRFFPTLCLVQLSRTKMPKLFEISQPQDSQYLRARLNEDLSVPSDWWNSHKTGAGVVIMRSSDNTISLVYPLGVALTRTFRDSDAEYCQHLQGPMETRYKLSTSRLRDLAKLVIPETKIDDLTSDTKAEIKRTVARAQRSFLGHVILRESQQASAAHSPTEIILSSPISAASRKELFSLLGEKACSPAANVALPGSPDALFCTWGEGTWQSSSGHLSMWAQQKYGEEIGVQIHCKDIFQNVLAPGAKITAVTSMMFDDDLMLKSQPKAPACSRTGVHKQKLFPQNATLNFIMEVPKYHKPQRGTASEEVCSQPVYEQQ